MMDDIDTSCDPIVSVIIPCFNNEETIQMCISSLKEQTYTNIEIILIDAYSTDKTINICDKFGINIFQRNLRRSAARFYGAQQASGDYLFHVDSDMQVGPVVIDECICRVKAGADALVIPEANLGCGLGSRATAFQKQYLAKSHRGYLRFVSTDAYFDVGGHHPDLVSGEDKYLHDRIRSTGYKIGFTNHRILHHTGSYGFFDALSDRLNYSKTTQKMIDELGEDRKKENPNWHLLLYELMTKPLSGAAFLLLTFLEKAVTDNCFLREFFEK